MFTVEQIKAAHSKVKSGADFPQYIGDIKTLGVYSYETFVTDGHTNYYGKNNYQITAPARYMPLTISGECNKEEFKSKLKEHQEGRSDYPTFIKMSATLGIEKWIVDTEKMNCTYFDKAGNAILVEQIPQR